MIGARIGIYSGKNTFTGILDEVSQTGYYGHSSRRLTKDFLITSPIIRLRRSSDNAEMDFSYSADSNCLDANSLETGGATNIVTWMGSDIIYVVKSYEQGGSGLHLEQTTAANQPIFNKSTYDFNAINISGVTRYLTRSVTPFGINLYSVNAVSGLTSSATGLYDGMLKFITPDPIALTGRTVWRSPDVVDFATPWVVGYKTWKCYYDGTKEYFTIGSNAYNRTITKSGSIGSFQWGLSAAGATNDTRKTEIIFRFGYDASDVAAIEANQKAYYGI